MLPIASQVPVKVDAETRDMSRRPIPYQQSIRCTQKSVGFSAQRYEQTYRSVSGTADSVSHSPRLLSSLASHDFAGAKRCNILWATNLLMWWKETCFSPNRREQILCISSFSIIISPSDTWERVGQCRVGERGRSWGAGVGGAGVGGRSWEAGVEGVSVELGKRGWGESDFPQPNVPHGDERGWVRSCSSELWPHRSGKGRRLGWWWTVCCNYRVTSRWCTYQGRSLYHQPNSSDKEIRQTWNDK